MSGVLCLPSSVLHLPQWAPGPCSASSSGLHVRTLHLSTQPGQSVLDCQRINRAPKTGTAGCRRGVPNESQRGDPTGIAGQKRAARLRVGSKLEPPEGPALSAKTHGLPVYGGGRWESKLMSSLTLPLTLRTCPYPLQTSGSFLLEVKGCNCSLVVESSFTCMRAWTSCPVRRVRAEVTLPGMIGPTAGPEDLRQIRGVFLGTKRTPKCEQNKAKERNMPHSAEPDNQIHRYFSSPVY